MLQWQSHPMPHLTRTVGVLPPESICYRMYSNSKGGKCKKSGFLWNLCWPARPAADLQVAGSNLARARFYVPIIYLFNSPETFEQAREKLANEKKSPSQWRFSCEKMGIYVITYKAKGFSAKNMPRRHLTDGPQWSDTLYATSAPDGRAPMVRYIVNTYKYAF